ncbi:MAG: hypothetical protein ACQETB_06750 [Halobacteriota archaeon]
MITNIDENGTPQTAQQLLVFEDGDAVAFFSDTAGVEIPDPGEQFVLRECTTQKGEEAELVERDVRTYEVEERTLQYDHIEFTDSADFQAEFSAVVTLHVTETTPE